MGTRSLTIVYDEWKDKPILGMYRQYDGYLSGHGQDLKDVFGDFQIINGISVGDNEKKANGMGCLAAQIVAHFKEGIGGIYIQSPKDYQEYNYHLHFKEGKIWIVVKGYNNRGKPIYEGYLSDMPTKESHD